MKNSKIISLLATLSVAVGFWLSVQPALALYSGTIQSDNLMECLGQCFEHGCPAGKVNMPVAGCPGYGYYCCVENKPQLSTPDCMGFCIEPDKCESVLPDPNKCDNGYVCCGAEKKETVGPTGLACCMPIDKCTTQINTAIVCPNAGDGCCIPEGGAGGGLISSDGRTCQSGFPCPLGEDIPKLLGSIIRWVLGFVGALFLAMFVWGGALYITAGDSKRAEEGKQTLINAVIGVMIVALSYTLVGWVLEKLTSTVG